MRREPTRLKVKQTAHPALLGPTRTPFNHRHAWIALQGPYTLTRTLTLTHRVCIPSFLSSFIALITALHIWACCPRVGSFIFHALSAYISISISILTISRFVCRRLFIYSYPLISFLLSSPQYTSHQSSDLYVLFRWVDSVSFISTSLYWTELHSQTQQSLTSRPIHQSDSQSASRLCSVCYHLYDKPGPEHQIPYSHA